MYLFFSRLFQMVFKIAGDVFVQVYTVASHHVVSVFRINEEVGVCASFDTCSQERVSVLGYAGGVGSADDDFQTAFQVAGFQFQVGAFVAFRIRLWRIHVTFAVHHFIELPVDDRSAGYPYLENVRISQHQVGCHEATEAPTMYADSFTVYVRQ